MDAEELADYIFENYALVGEYHLNDEINEETGCGERDYVLCPKCGAVSSVTDMKFGEKLCECGSEYIHITESDVTKDERKLKCPACEFGIITPIVNGANAATSVLATELYEQLPDKKTVSKKSAPVEDDDLFGGLEESVREKSEELTRQFLCFSDTGSGAAYFGLHRIIIFVQSRREFFVRLYENDEGILDVFRGVFGQYGEKISSE